MDQILGVFREAGSHYLSLPNEFPEIVCLCGSTRFAQEYEKEQARLTDEGRIVLSVGRYGHQDGLEMDGEHKKMLDELHKRKIDLCERVHVINSSIPTCNYCHKPCESTFHPIGAAGYSNSICCRADVVCKPYVGASTNSEITYALHRGKKVTYLNPPKE